MQTVSAAVKSIEDHGYVLDLGESLDISGFLPFKKTENKTNHPIGALLDVTVEKMADDGRTCFFDGAKQLFEASLVKHLFRNTSG